MIKKNELIAKFMGAKVELRFSHTPVTIWKVGVNDQLISKEYKSRDLKYHRRWDWLMPVWRKCADIIGPWAVTSNEKSKLYGWEERMKSISHALTTVDIVRTHREVVECIEWYNSYNK